MTQSPATAYGCAPPGHLGHVRRARRLPRHPGRGDGARRRGPRRRCRTAWRWWPTTTRTSCRSSGPTTTARRRSSSRCCASAAPSSARWSTSWRSSTRTRWPSWRWPGNGWRRGPAVATRCSWKWWARWGRCGRTWSSTSTRRSASACPLAAEYLSAEEWGQLPGHGLAAFDGDKVWLILGLIRERMNEEQREAMLSHMPPPAVQMWTGFGEHAFNELAAQVAVEVQHRVL